MNSPMLGRVGLLFLLAAINISRATIITSDTSIPPDDLSFDGADIIITNCTVTLDGAHGFNSLQILNGGILTHSPYTNTTQTITNTVTGEAQILSSTNAPTLNNVNVDASTIVVTDQSATTTYTNGVDYVVTVLGQYTQLSFPATNNSSIPDGATVLVSYNWVNTTTIAPGFNLTISNDTQVALGGTINVSGKGYLGGSGTGAGGSRSTSVPYAFTAGAGGSHGGYGGMSTSGAAGGIMYDSLTNPAAAGSGGGTGSGAGTSGGGVAQLIIGGTMQLDGQILANGLAATNAHAGGGAGGSIFISAQTISGSGSISANGGSAELPDGGGGGGGRIAVYFTTNNFTGTISAFGGVGANYGGAGTVFVQAAAAAAGQLTIDNGGHRGTNTFFGPVAVSNLTVTGSASVQFYTAMMVSNLLVGANSSIDSGSIPSLQITVSGNAMIQSNATVSADFKSTSSGSSWVSCSSGNSGTGGSHAGFGGAGSCGRNGGTLVFGSITQPTSAGISGGTASGLAPRGGGILRLVVGGSLSLAGRISADGASGAGTAGAGGGAGGSVWISAGTLSGNGAISANGGAANNALGGGGSGGRVAVYFDTNSFTGSIKAAGGAAANGGGAGTVYLQRNNSASGSLTVDNGGVNGALTPLSLVGLSDFTISGGAVVSNNVTVAISLRNLFVGSNGWFQLASVNASLTASNAVIQSGGGIVANGVSSSSTGAGQTANLTGGGGANAGYGGDSASSAAGGSYFSSSATSPVSPGGYGGAGYNGSGGRGGGAIMLTVNQTLQLDGIISANGDAGSALNSGGGAGGSVWITAGTISGSGALSANGGNGNDLGGGGSGGRIAVLCYTNLFTGDLNAFGGAGANNGSAGSIYLNQNNYSANGKFILDNDGPIARPTPFSTDGFPLQPFDLIVTGGAALTNYITSILTLNNLVVGSNSVLFIASSSLQTLVVNTNATIFPGGKIIGDGFGTRSSPNGYNGGGGGYGGAGGASSIGGSTGGGAYQDSIIQPTGGGAYGGSYTSSGSKGGGALKITVYGIFELDGKISADGLVATNAAGAGSGGSIWLSARTLSGNGALSANGGSALSSMGGGGGGRIALWVDTNQFTGTLSACGGAGAYYGGAGTICLNPNFSTLATYPQIAIDNGGNSGATTPLWSSSITTLNLAVTGNAFVSNSIPSLSMGTLLVGSNSTMYFASIQPTLTATNGTIQQGGKIHSDGISPSTLRTGQILNSSGGGGGYGGAGGASFTNALGGATYSDSLTSPQTAGSIGGGGLTGNGGYGGGAFHLTFRGTLQLDGTISASGVTGSGFNSGGGSGGAVWIQAGAISGNGVISANGGAANNLGGGGGGGRVALWFNTNAFVGNLMARGGAGANYGGAGTVYTTSSFYGNGNSSRLIIDNGGAHGTNTVLNSIINGDLLITDGATASLSSGAMTWNNLTIASNGILNLAVPATMTPMNVYGNLLIQRGGSLLLDGQGYSANNGSGHGSYAWNGSSYIGSGGGHGGMGSSGNSTVASGVNFDDIINPTQPGSGGGVYIGGGSAGGGALRLTVTGLAMVDGLISANGLSATAPGGGGGAGGAVWLSAGGIAGSGKISADGGAGDPFAGGGGGGGRIAVLPLATGPGTFITNGFTGTFSARGGAGFAVAGGAGTIYLQTNYPNPGLLLLDNGSMPGTNTPLSSLSQPVALAIRNGAAANSTVPLTVQTFSLSNATFNVINPVTVLNLTVLGDASIDNGGSVTADTAGYFSGSGPGAGAVDGWGNGGGGGYGGAGAPSWSGANGGVMYGSSNQPVDFGSAGGTSPVLPNFAQGGGAIRLAVHGTLNINGAISANGNDGIIEGAGGGSGGSIWIDTKTLSGNGGLTANGGNGESTQGGGGGGGRIAVYLATNSFSGSVLASGGDGASPGQDGTIYWQTNLVISGGVFDTNGAPIADITLQPDGFAAITTDTNGSYSITVPPFWSGNIVASGGGFFYVPNLRTYASLQTNALEQNFMAASSASDFNFANIQSNTGTNIDLQWHGYPGVQYQPLYSTNLVDWLPYGSAMVGTNGPMILAVPNAAPQMYFRLSVTY